MWQHSRMSVPASAGWLRSPRVSLVRFGAMLSRELPRIASMLPSASLVKRI